MPITSLASTDAIAQLASLHMEHQKSANYEQLIALLKTQKKEEIMQSMIEDISELKNDCEHVFNALKERDFNTEQGKNEFIKHGNYFIAGIESMYHFHPKLLENTPSENQEEIERIYFAHIKNMQNIKKTPIYISNCYQIFRIREKQFS